MEYLEKLLVIPLPPIYVVEKTNTDENNQKFVENLTWNDIFKIVQSQHWHSVLNSAGKIVQRCPHNESLWDHLKKCGQICMEQALKMGKSNPAKYYLAGLLHDIGKPATFKAKGKKTSFKGHALVGGAVIENLWTNQLGEVFNLTIQDWAEISTAIDTHMCGYFPNCPVECSTIYMDTFRLLPNGVRDILSILRLGDCLSLRPHLDDESTNHQEIVQLLETQFKFVYNISLDLEPSKYVENYGLTKGVLIQIHGSSASGKSTLARLIVDKLNITTNHVLVVSRDVIMVRLSRKYMGLSPINGNFTPEIYRDCRKYYIDNDKFYADKINAEMRQTIDNGLEAGYIVVTDTMATMFPVVAKKIIPDNAKNAFKISIWCHRNQLISAEETANRLGMFLEEQLIAHGTQGLMNPFQELIWYDVTSLTENRPNTEINNVIGRPHISISLGQTGIKIPILEHLLNYVTKIYEFNQSFSRIPILEQTIDLNLSQLLAKLYKGGSAEWIKQFFQRYGYIVNQPMKGTPYENIVYGIKYIDGLNNIWKPRWAREARGRFYLVNGEDNAIPLKNTLQRGIELITKVHLDCFINETQDIRQSTLDRVDTIQAKLLQTFNRENEPLDGWLTGKVDGSLLLLNYYPIQNILFDYMINLIEALEAIGTHVLYVKTQCGLIVPATQGTLFMGDDMWDYFLTAVMASMKYINKTKQPFKVWNEMKDLVADWVERQICLLPFDKDKKQVEMINLAYEMVCPNRTTYRGKIHTELAVNYPIGGISLLGVYFENQYYPHFDLDATKLVVQHPISLRISSTSQVFQIMRDLNNVILGKYKMNDFMERYFPEQINYPLHPEGFVYLHKLTYEYGNGYDYSKIKLPIYYDCHKIRENNIPYLLSLPENIGEYFPVVKNLRKFFTNMEPNLFRITMSLYNEINRQLTRNSTCYNMLNPKAQARINIYLDMIECGDEQNQPEIKKNLEIILKMLIHICDEYFKGIYYNIAKEVYDINIEMANPNQLAGIVSFSKELLMKVQPWKNCVSTEIKMLIETKDPILKKYLRVFD